jgi:hypothetical protein
MHATEKQNYEQNKRSSSREIHYLKSEKSGCKIESLPFFGSVSIWTTLDKLNV